MPLLNAFKRGLNDLLKIRVVGAKIAVRGLCVKFGGKEWIFTLCGIYLTYNLSKSRTKMDERRILRNQKLREQYKKEYETGLRTEIIVEKLSRQYALATLTIEAIIFRKGVYKEA